MDEPLKCWYCDTCSEKIENSDLNNARIIWQEIDNKEFGFKIVHGACLKRSTYDADDYLKDCLDKKGITHLLSFLCHGAIKTNQGESPSCKISDFNSFVDLFRRLHTPYYEEARKIFKNEEFLDSYRDVNGVMEYYPDNLKEMITKYLS